MDAESIIRVIDDDDGLRESLNFLLHTEGFSVRSYASAADFLEQDILSQDGCVITDLRMPGMSGVDLLKEIRRRKISLPIIVISAIGDVPLAVAAMKEGASDFIEKPFRSETLMRAIKSAIESQKVKRKDQAGLAEVLERRNLLSQREYDVLLGLVNGKPNKIIAYELGIGIRTVESHRASIMHKMKVKSLSELVRKAIAAQIL